MMWLGAVDETGEEGGVQGWDCTVHKQKVHWANLRTKQVGIGCKMMGAGCC